MNQADWIRVSCATLCRIAHPSLGYFLLVNRNRQQKGLYILSPIGGALEYEDESILARFNAHPEEPAAQELRLMMPVGQLPAFREWFYSGQGREASPFRELREELVYESKLLPELRAEDVRFTRLWTVERERMTDRRGHTGLLTHYFLEIYAVTFSREAVWGQLIAAPQAQGAMWLSEDQIAGEQPVTMFIDGEQRAVRVNARILLQPPQQPAGSPASPA